MTEVKGIINPGRVLEAFAASGYSPESALCDIIDNSVTWGASNIRVELERDPDVASNRLNNALSYIISDDGQGMDDARLRDALALGSVATYPDNSLSLFGLGLKAAGFSQGECIEVCTKEPRGTMLLARVDLDSIKDRGEYVYDLTALDATPSWATFLDEPTSGTVVRLSKIRAENQPSVSSTADALRTMLGVVYRYFLGNKLGICLAVRAADDVQESVIGAFDPLFSAEAEANEAAWKDGQSPISRGDWDGRSVEWLRKPTNLVLDPGEGVVGSLSITQLPHPPSFGQEGRAPIREKYRINATNYGIYVYRNKRLIVAADRFDGLIKQSLELYGLRVELHIDESADAAMNIDLKKSRILLSNAARSALDDEITDAKRESRNAWRNRTAQVKAEANSDPDSVVEGLLATVALPTEMPNDPQDAASEKSRREREQAWPSAAQDVSGRRIIFVPQLDDNAVWEHALDPTHGVAVRVNSGHRFIRDIRNQYEETAVAIVMQSILLALSNAEQYVQRSFLSLPASKVEELMTAFRAAASASLANIAREISDKLDDLEA